MLNLRTHRMISICIAHLDPISDEKIPNDKNFLEGVPIVFYAKNDPENNENYGWIGFIQKDEIEENPSCLDYCSEDIRSIINFCLANDADVVDIDREGPYWEELYLYFW